MSQSVHHGRLWSCTNDGVQIHSIGGDYPVEAIVGLDTGSPIRPLSSWRTSIRRFVLALARHSWSIIDDAAPAVVATKPAVVGTIIGGYVDRKTQTLYVVELVGEVRYLVTWALDGREITPGKIPLRLPSDLGASGGQVVLAGRLGGRRHLAILVGLSTSALVDVSDPRAPVLTSVIPDGGTAIAVEDRVVYLQAGQGEEAWISTWKVDPPELPRRGPTEAISGLWGDGPDLRVARFDGRTFVLSHDVRVGGEEEWLLVHEHREAELVAVAEHRLASPDGDIAIDTIDRLGDIAMFWGYGPAKLIGGEIVIPYYLTELELATPGAPPRMVRLP